MLRVLFLFIDSLSNTISPSSSLLKIQFITVLSYLIIFQNDTDKGRVDSGKQESYCKIKNEADLVKHASEYINAIIISEDDIENLQVVKEKLAENTNIHGFIFFLEQY